MPYWIMGAGPDATLRNVTGEANPERFRLFRLCDCPTCEGKGKAKSEILLGTDGQPIARDRGARFTIRCPDCRGEGRVRQEIATCATPEAVGVAIVTLAREGEWDECPLGLLDGLPDCDECDVSVDGGAERMSCAKCKGSGVKPTGTWLITPWLPSARNVTDAARTLAKSKKTVS
jgi:DnaJ-class molecular chaperone